MSNTLTNAEQPCDILPPPCAAVELILQPREKDLGGFSVRRLLPTTQRKMVGPWIFFDHMGPAHFPAGQGITVRPHPHIGIATVTYLFEGEILHRDSLGSLQAIRPGDINLMVAGSGIVHSERAVYVASGALKAQDAEMPTYSMTVFADRPGIVVRATEAARIAVIGGAPVGEREIEWNFVSSRTARIDQAKRDWVEGRFPKVPGDEVEFIPLP